MERTIVGIDISMETFHACVKTKKASGPAQIKGTRSFENKREGFKGFLAWALKKGAHNQSFGFVMEATGIYHENLAYFLYENGQTVSVVLANKIKNYAKSLNLKTKTDLVDSKLIAGFGIERDPEAWEPLSAQYRELRSMCREMMCFKKEKRRAQSQLHAMEKSHGEPEEVVNLKNEQIGFYEAAIASLQKNIRCIVDGDAALKEKIRKVQTIPGLGFETIAVLACETNGFRLFKNIRQVVSYAGLDVSHNESGKNKGRARISKKGNSRIRQALYMPSLSAIRANGPIAELHQRVCGRNPETKQKGVVASMRKLLVLAYVLWKKDEEYDKNHQWSGRASGNEEIKPSFGLFAKQKKAEPKAPHEIDFGTKYRLKPSFGQYKGKNKKVKIRI